MKLPEKWKTSHDVFDEFTWRALGKLEAQGHFDQLVSSISQGKEAHIFLALKKDGTKVIVKIYRMMNCNFNKMFGYIKSDPRYADLKGRRRQIILAWVQREYRNLLLAREHHVRAPTPYAIKDHIIVMEYIGDEDGVAPQAKDADIVDPKAFMAEIHKQNNILLTKAKLVHADLSMFNILVHNQLPVLIDMSQTTSIEDQNAQEYKERDAKNLALLEKRLGILHKE